MVKSDGTVYIDTQIDTSGVGKGAEETKRKINAISNSAKKLGDTIRNSFTGVSTGNVGRAYEEIERDIKKAEVQLDKLIEKQIRFVEIGGNRKSQTFAGMEYDIEMARNKLLELQAELSTTSKKASKSTNVLKKGLSNATQSIKKMGDTSKKSHYSLLRMLGTSLLFSMVFKALSAVTQGFVDGLNNLVQYSDEANSTMSSLKSSLTQLKNSFATAFMPIITIVSPALNKLISMIVQANNLISQFFAALTGKSTYTKAIAVQEDYAKSLDNTADAAKKAQNYVSGLDELNIVSKEDSSSGGISAGDMFEEVPIDNKILEFIEKIKDSFSGLVKFLGEVKKKLEEIFEDIKLGDFKELGADVSDLAILIFDFISEAISSVDWESVGEKIGDFLAGIKWVEVIKSALRLRYNIWKAIAEVWFGSFQAAPIETTILSALGILKFSGLGALLANKLKTALLTSLPGAVKAAFAGFVEWIPHIALLGAIVAVANEIKKTMESAFDTSEWSLWDWITNTLEVSKQGWIMQLDMWRVELEVWWQDTWLYNELWNLGQWWNTYIAPWFTKEQWTKLFNNVINAANTFKKGFVDIWNGIVLSIKDKINQIISAINSMISGVGTGINNIINALNALSFDIPDWVPSYGGKSFGLNISNISVPQIPYLATGAVIPPNAPFMAMLGDQKHGTNLEAPESLIRQIVREEAGGSTEMMALLSEIAQNTRETADKDLTIGDRDIARANIRGQQSMGYSLITVG